MQPHLPFLAASLLAGAVVAARPRPAATPRPVSPRKKPMARPAPARPAKPIPTAPVVTPPAPAPEPAARVLSGPLNLGRLLRDRQAAVTSSAAPAADVTAGFDGKRGTQVRLAVPAGGSAFVQVVLTRPRPLDAAEVTFEGGGPATWSLLAADSEADMRGRRGSFRIMAPERTAQHDTMDQATFAAAPPARVYRLECRSGSGAEVVLGDCALWAPQTLAELKVDAFVDDLVKGDMLQLRSRGVFDAGARQNLTLETEWEVSPPSRGRVDAVGRFEALEPGSARVVAKVGKVRSAPYALEVLERGLPDWDVTYIERQPRIGDQSPDSQLRIGQNVYWFAHVRNYGTCTAEPVGVEFLVDGKRALAGRLPKLERFASTEVILSRKWDGERHEIRLVVDPDREAEETSEENNSLAVATDSRGVGFWVEDSTLRYFHLHQRDLGIGSNSWEDWAQRQIALWNARLAESGSDGAARERWRLDRLVVVGDGMLPLDGAAAESQPDPREKSVHFMWGFPAYDPAASDLYRRTREKSDDNPFYQQLSLFQALSRACYAAEPARAAAGP
jgi:hypothetical protein